MGLLWTSSDAGSYRILLGCVASTPKNGSAVCDDDAPTGMGSLRRCIKAWSKVTGMDNKRLFRLVRGKGSTKQGEVVGGLNTVWKCLGGQVKRLRS